MALQLDRNLWSRHFNAETREAIDLVNMEARYLLPPETYNGEWDTLNTLRLKQEFLARYKEANKKSLQEAGQ